MIRTASTALSLTLLLAVFARPLVAADADWPREITRNGTTFVVYEPQPDSLDGDTLLSRSAVSIQRPGDDTPVFGAIETTARLDIDRDSGRARIIDLHVDRVRFPGLREDGAEARDLASMLEQEVPRWNLELSLDDLKGSLEAQAGTADLRNTPPKFVYIDQPAILISIDGEPRLRAIGNTGLERVVNTPFPVVYDRATRRYYFYGSSVWFTTNDLTRGRWTALRQPPANVAALFADDERQDANDSSANAGNAPTLTADQLRRARIIVATEPTELISTDGRPALQPLVGSELLTVANTDSDLFFDVPGQTWYIVVSGRWYRARTLTGDWTWVEPDRLPASFARIPASSPKADALAHVPGTEAAKDAVMDAVIPQVAAVDREDAHFEATYDGTPRFEAIPGTDLRYAVNTASQVILADGRYYAVEQGVWFIADSPYGPWAVSETRPVGLDHIPPSSPAYNTRYVYIYDVRPDVVYMGYTPGYLWAFPYDGVIVYGTGYRYRPWYGPDWYYPRPWTWGFSVHYSPWSGWNYGMSWNAGWIGLSWAWGNGWGQWHQGYRRGYNRGYWSGYNRGYWNGVHGGGWFGPGGYRPPVNYPRHPHYRPDARPVKYDGGRGAYATRERRPDNVYLRPDNANLHATRPSARYWGDASGRRAEQSPRTPQVAPRPGRTPLLRPAPSQPDQSRTDRWRTGRPQSDRPAGSRQDNRPDERVSPPPSARPNNMYADGENNVYRWRSNQWQRLDERDRWQPAAPSVGSRPIQRPASPQRPAAPVESRRPVMQPSRPQIQHTPAPQREIRAPQRDMGASRGPRGDQGARPEVRPRDGGSLNSTRERRERGAIREQ